MALSELKLKLPHGDVGRIINSFIFYSHEDAEKEARKYRKLLYNNIPTILTLSIFQCSYAFSYKQSHWDKNSFRRQLKWIKHDCYGIQFSQKQSSIMTEKRKIISYKHYL